MTHSEQNAKGFIIAAPKSASGKTTITLGLLTALRRRNIKVHAAKSGPDYIDPAFHSVATQATSFNLDSWAMPPDLLDYLFASTLNDTDITIIESSMGFFDGIETENGKRGCGADLAERYKLPVILVMDVTGQAQSAAAIAYGFANINPNIQVKGVILNNVASPRHLASTEAALKRIHIPVLGSIPRDPSLHLPARHLGLIQAEEHHDLDQHLNHLADIAEQHININALLNLDTTITIPKTSPVTALLPLGQHIAIAKDIAFSFIYPHILDGWINQGANIHFFSPMNNEAPPEHCDVCWLPGGYPELYAGQLANQTNFIQGMQHFSLTRPVHGECGGYMVMGNRLVDKDGVSHHMLGLLSHSCSYEKRKMHLGYRKATLNTPKQELIHGHEFHYATVIDPGHDLAYATLTDGTGNPIGAEGGRRNHITGCFFHSIALQP
ncbi:cobyrinate a,c-diamide synthase [Commensalibacter papalotli (ex Servin-Garciduenas et al. 2014)]|uniref:Cobyrinate a,c-diamide synthase n=1 Tax=Commensalibacter papalotli (ex Servin-Garciduenas et al. 2014) TaxID=1208583 RepID=W7DS03_9PROT|nr:cobyrinate a,c-diamide synthase [Commensalibacter papalotli (ex Servin-Garciduenas et al. 2014)]EUK17655.1 cobyrinic acid a,c-diamide synthase [Commensalibacter papalotli (ex Servin-Garciduenas et al. 2014)]